MSQITPKFDFTAAYAQLGTGQSHTSAQTPENNLAPIKFNEYERVMVAICAALGNPDLSDIFPGAAPTIESAFRTLEASYDSRFASLDTSVASYQSAITSMEAAVSTNYTSMQELVTQETSQRVSNDTALNSRIDALQAIVQSSNSTVNTSLLEFMNTVDTRVSTLEGAVVYKASGSAQSISDPVTFTNSLTLSGGNVFDAGTSPIRTTHTPAATSDVTTLGYNESRYVKQSGDGVVTGDFTIGGRLIGGLPIGAVMMFDGSSWVDNSTMPGWYACVAGNSAKGCPDMVGRFVMGRGISDAKVTGGSDSVTLGITNLPSHTHTIVHDHGTHTHVANPHTHTISGSRTYQISTSQNITSSSVVVTSAVDDHTHSGTITQPEFTETQNWNLVSGTGGSYAGYDLSTLYTPSGSSVVSGSDILTRTKDVGIIINTESIGVYNTAHNHSITAADLTAAQSVTVDFSYAIASDTTATIQTTNISLASGTSGPIGSGASFDITPKYYSMIYIRRCE